MAEITFTTVKNILTRTSGYLGPVCSHSLQPYRGCTFGNALCGAGCYVQHSRHLLQGRKWGAFLEVRQNAAESYLGNVLREAAWGRRQRGLFSIFLSSATDPFLPQERSFRVTGRLLEAMLQAPPDELILQTHSHHVLDSLEVIQQLAECCRLRVHVSIESDRDRLPGLPPPACSVQQRLDACRKLKAAGIRTIVTVAPLLPIEDPSEFFRCIAEVADAVVIDHFIAGDGSRDGRRTLQTALPEAMAAIEPRSVRLEYRDEIVEQARRVMPGRVGVNVDGFAGRYLPTSRARQEAASECSQPLNCPGRAS